MKIDLGCGPRPREGFVGVDKFAGPGVQHVVDLEREPLPFPDDSVDEVFSSHFFEHVADPGVPLRELVRVAKNGARVVIWTPHACSALATLPGHVTFFNETVWEHFCMRFPEIWLKDAGGVLRLDEFRYVLVSQLARTMPGTQLPYAIKHLSNVVLEFAAAMTVCKPVAMAELDAFKRSEHYPTCSFGMNRDELRPLRAPPGFWSIDEPMYPTWAEADRS